MFIVKCPGCGKEQKTQPRPGLVTSKTKRCVYCGRNFKIHGSMPKSRIVKKV
ncbi:hypothetical protein GOV07_02900 [Candidatus Woesearchaeota archaeon]|nr:hypothetical protein [Candidatus Woesearchaeota archaeon]